MARTFISLFVLHLAYAQQHVRAHRGLRTLQFDSNEQELAAPSYPSYASPQYLPQTDSPTPAPKIAFLVGAIRAQPLYENPAAMSPALTAPTYVSPEEQLFRDECIYDLLRGSVVKDELISQLEFVEFLQWFCEWKGNCTECGNNVVLTFDTLPYDVKAAFVGPLCINDPACSILSTPVFGYVYNKDTYEETESQITELCNTLYPLLGSLLPIPDIPTSAPNGSPVVAPHYPSTLPTETLTHAPVTPSSSSTQSPSNSPSVSTSSPSLSPSISQSNVLATATPSLILESVSPSHSLTPSQGPLVPLSPIFIEMPVSSVPFSDAPSLSSLTPTALVVRSSQSPSTSVTLSPSSSTVIFINEVGTIDGTVFVEVAYSENLGSGITTYSIFVYSVEGTVLGSAVLPEGDNVSNGLVFTYVTTALGLKASAAFALVNDATNDVQFFLSIGEVVTAADGPAQGMRSILLDGKSIAASSTSNQTFANSRLLQNVAFNSTGNTSISLVGDGCEFSEFHVGETTSTPGDVNVGQNIEGCNKLLTPSLTPTSSGSAPNEGITTEAIIATAVSGAFLLILIVSIFFLRSEREASNEPSGKRASDKPSRKDVNTAKSIADTPTTELLADKGSAMDVSDLEALIAGSDVASSAGAVVVGTKGGEVTDNQADATRSGWMTTLFQRSSKKTEEATTDTLTPVLQSASSAAPSAVSTDAASIALSRRDDDSEEEVALSPAAGTSEALQNLDAALDKHDWNAVYNIANTITQTETPGATPIASPTASPVASPGRNRQTFLGFMSTSGRTSRAANEALPSNLLLEPLTSSGRVLGAVRRTDDDPDIDPDSGSVQPSDVGSGIIGASPRKDDNDGDLSFAASNIAAVGAGSVLAATEKELPKTRKGRNWIGGLFRGSTKKEEDSTESSVNVIQSSMEAIQKEFDPQLPSRAAEDTNSVVSIGTGSMGEASSFDLQDRQRDSGVQQIDTDEEDESDADRSDIVFFSSDSSAKRSTLMESIEKMAQELERDALETTLSLSSGDEDEAMLEQLIDSKDWRGVDEFVKNMEIFNESELEAIKNRNESLESEEEKKAQKRVKKELEAITRRDNDAKQGSMYQADSEDRVVSGVKNLIPYWRKKEEEASQSSGSASK